MERRLIKVFVISDSHFFHWKICEYCNRGFPDVKTMNSYMITEWNRVVDVDDVVFHLGDFGFSSFLNIKRVFDRLNGVKYLVMGNHDRRRSVGWWTNIGFIKVFKNPITFNDKVILSHYPQRNNHILNIHGHIHNNGYDSEFVYRNHVNVSVEEIDYKPRLLNNILEKRSVIVNDIVLHDIELWRSVNNVRSNDKRVDARR